MTRIISTLALAAFCTIAALCPAGAEEAEYDGEVKWSVDVPEIETPLYDYLTKERTYKADYNVDVHLAPHPFSEVISVLDDHEEFTVVEAYTAWSEDQIPDPNPYPISRNTYMSAYRIESADLEGWIFEVDAPIRCLVRFGEDYYPLREGPSLEYRPLTREEEAGHAAHGYDLWLKATVEAGSVYEPLCVFEGWISVGRDTSIGYDQAGGWLPVDAPALEFFVPAFSGGVINYDSVGGGFCFFIPCAFPSAIIYESYSIYPRSFTDEYISVTAVDRVGEEHTFQRDGNSRVFVAGAPDFGEGYIAFKADTAVDWTEVERVYVKLNEPRLLLKNDEFEFDFPNERLPKE
ncbi:MAG: hypothetical protein PVH29_07955 [Candidatus Zixiibacteriota bacterium]|jgi:hypothetical protein